MSSGAGDHGVENFYPRPPCGGRPRHKRACTETWRFLSTSPLRGTTHRGITGGAVAAISIHVPLAGDDRWKPRRPSPAAYFYPRPPCGGRLRRRYILGQKWEFLSTSPLRGTTCDIFGGKYKIIHISIHVPLAGDDQRNVRYAHLHVVISIHVPLAGDDAVNLDCAPSFWSFLSTSPLRGTTAGTPCVPPGLPDFYPRPPCGGRPIPQARISATLYFYPRPPCGGRPGRCSFW